MRKKEYSAGICLEKLLIELGLTDVMLKERSIQDETDNPDWKISPQLAQEIVNYFDSYCDGTFDFAEAIERLKEGRCVARQGWNGRGMYLWLMPAAKVKAAWCREPHLKAVAEANGGEIEALGTIRMMTADRRVLTGWLASQSDMLAEDWFLVSGGADDPSPTGSKD